mgnify:CR=1 FL=1
MDYRTLKDDHPEILNRMVTELARLDAESEIRRNPAALNDRRPEHLAILTDILGPAEAEKNLDALYRHLEPFRRGGTLETLTALAGPDRLDTIH